MKKFVALYMAPIEEFQKFLSTASPEDMKAGMARWEEWGKTLGKSMVDMGAPLGKTKRVTQDHISDVKNDVGGYSIVQAESHDQAAKLFIDCPHFEIAGAWVDVMECMHME